MAVTRVAAMLDPYILALLGTVGLAAFLPASGPVADIFGVAGDVAIFLLFFLHGAKLSRAAIWGGIRHWRLHLLVPGFTCILFPLIGPGIARSHIVPADIATGLLFLALLPSTVQSSIAFTAIARSNVAAAVCSASLSNLSALSSRRCSWAC